MGKKLTKREKEERVIQRAIRRIKTIEKDYGVEVARCAAQRYALRRREEAKLEREIKEKEEELQRMKKLAQMPSGLRKIIYN